MAAKLPTLARVLLALIRLVNGILGLVTPYMITRRFSEEGANPPAAQYALRMFGIRTILVALELLWPAGPTRTRAVRVAPLIHASDLVAAIIASRREGVPRRTGMLIVGISAVNTLLSLVMQAGVRSGDDSPEAGEVAEGPYPWEEEIPAPAYIDVLG